MELLKRFARWVLAVEITKLKSERDTIEAVAKRIGTRLESVHPAPPLLDNGEDMTENLQWRVDLSCVGVTSRSGDNFNHIPAGTFKVWSPITNNIVTTEEK
jgi:hypothetical protein